MWKKGKKLRSSALAILLATSMIVGMVPGGMGQVQAAEGKAKAEEEVGFLDKAKGFFSDIGEGIADLFDGKEEEVQPIAAFDEASIVDGDTSQSWTGVVEYNTQNIGRIWTDKSVYNKDVDLPGIGGGADIPITKPEDSDFMVGLSALSSTSNTSVTTQTPLDIVLVLDLSGSMAQNLGTAVVYSETYNVSTNSRTTYYALDDNGEYVEIEKVTRWDTNGWWPTEVFDHWELNGVKVEPKTRNDNNPNHIQFYTRSTRTISKMDGLKTAVNGFIDATAAQNATITDEAKRHHISIVKYADDSYYQGNVDSVGDHRDPDNRNYNYSEIVSNLTGDMQAVKTAVNDLQEAGGTAADFGMNLANRVLETGANHGARANAQKVVVMFTDGEPNHGNNFDSTVATEAITNAKILKDAKALVYTIGVVSGANPEADINTDREENINAYLHSVSSNYPDATGWGRQAGSWGNVWRLGDRAEGSDFYKAATNSEELNGIFQEISEEINTGTGYPTETEDGFANEDGYVTFHDQLGDYMKVDSFNTLVLEDRTFEAKKSEEGGVVKYTYTGTAGEGKDVSKIVIEVTPGTGSAGDTVDVSIPAALLPLRHFQVDVSENTMTVTDKYPLRLFYNASLRDEAKEALANPDQDMKNYIAENSKDGEVYFYSNKYTGSKQGPSEKKTLGDTVATFEPATGNSFYYFTENTLLWADPEGKIPVKEYNANQEQYYYKKTYYKVDNDTTSGAPEQVEEVVSFRSHPRDEVEDWVGTATDGQLYIKAGAPRLTRIHDLTLGKGESAIPNTATEVITPNWDDETNQTNIEVSLGNNGRLAVELPGTLEIKKMVTSEVTAPEENFNFKLSLTNAEGEALTGTFDAQKFDAQGKVSGDAFTVQNDATITLKHGESVQIYGLSNGDQYSIEETEIPAGFKTTTNPMEGTIVGNKVTTAEFVNTYAVEPLVIAADDAIRGQKVLEGRDWKDTDSFAIRLTGRTGTPLPEANEEGETVEGNAFTKVVKNDDEFSFGSMTFDRPGEYVYTVSELSSLPGSNEGILGIHYSKGMYRVEVDVDDNGEGKLSAKITMTQTMSDDGEYIANPEALESPVATFTNVYDAADAQWAPNGRKVYTDHSGENPLEAQMFHFQVEAEIDENHTEAGPLPKSAENGKYTTSHSVNGDIVFEQLTFGSELVGKNYLYKITEKNEGVQGMTYDDTVYYLEVTIGAEGEGNNAITTVTSKYLDENKQELQGVNKVVFENSYTPNPVIIGTDTETGIAGTKTLIGRDMNENEFSFTLTANNQAAIGGLADDSIVFEGDNTKDSMTATAPAAKNGSPANFAFGSIQFTKPGEYTFNMKEVVPDQDGNGLKYDRDTEVVTVKVVDKGGVLEAAVSYDADGAAFENIYTASHSYGDDGGVVVTKTMNGRRMSAGEFDFTITGIGDNADEANKKLADADKSFQNVAARAGATTQMPKLQNVQFTEADAGQTFTYLIDEVMPHDDKKAGGVTYDQSEYTLAITVTDDGDGTMSTSTTVSRVKTSEGTTLETPVELGTYTAGAEVVAVPFVNTYKAGSVTVDTSDTEAGARLRKILEGRDWTANDEFTFTMTPQDGAPMPEENPDAGITKDKDGNLQAVVTAEEGTASGTEVNFGFGKITYDKAGTYVYTVTENVPEPKAGGMTYSKNVVTITVTVTDSGTGALTANLTASGTVSGRRFINTYDASLNLGEAGGLVITKTLNGHDMAAEQFEFQIKAVGTDTATKEEAAELFGFKQGETSITFKNPQSAEAGSTVTMKKTDVDFTLENLGKVYKYEVTEMDGKQGGYTYDSTVYTVELWVTDDNSDGTLTLHTKVNDKEPVESSAKEPKETILAFTNSYAATGTLGGETAIEVTKVLDGRKWIDSDSFSFKLEATGDTVGEVGKTVTLPDNASKLVIDGKDKDKKAAFGNITFTKPGTYTFAVSEIVPKYAIDNKLNGITYDTSVKNITVEVTDKHDGTLTAKIIEGSGDLTFTNTYTASTVVLPTDKQFKVTKTLVGRDWTDADKFEFKLTAVGDAPMQAEGGNAVRATKDAQTATFGSITYNKAGTYEYQIKETVPEDKEKGMTYDEHTATVTVTVEENFATGTLSVTSVTYSDGSEGAKFTNIVGNNTKEVKSGDKNVNNGMIGVGDELTYVINWVNDGVDEETGAPAAATVTITDKIPAGTEFVSAENGGVHKDGTVTWTIDAEAAATGSVSFKVVVTDKSGGTAIENQGEIKVGDNDPKVTNTVQTTVPGKTETSKPDKIEEGTILTYEIKFHNTDGADAKAEVVDNMTPGLEYQNGSATVGGKAVEPSVEGTAASGQKLTWNLENLAENEDVTITFKVKVTRDALESVDNSATVNGHKSNVVTTPYPSDDKKSVEDENGKDQNNGMVGVGDKLTYTIDWAAEEAGKVTITDKVPTGTTFVEASKGGAHEDGTVTWIIDNVKKGQKGSVSFSVEVTKEAAGKDVLNQANVKVGENDPKVTNEVETFIPGKDSAVEGGGELQVGSVLKYTISYKNPEAEAATVTITDKIPEGLDYVAESAGENASYNEENRILTWTLENVPAGQEGTVTFRARVNENAEEKVENKATIQIGENAPKYETDTDSKPVQKTGSLAINKKIALTENQGVEVDDKKSFTFTVNLKDKAGQPLTSEYAYTITKNKEKVDEGKVKDGETILLRHDETAMITGLPTGVNYTVTETETQGYTTSVGGEAGNVANGSITAEETAKANFTNTYSVTGDLSGSENLTVVKEFAGREGNQWLESDKFTFKLETADEATTKAVDTKLITLPKNAGNIEIAGDTEGHKTSFGNITFNVAGTFKFKVTENPSGIAGVTDDKDNVREIVVKVTDNGDGTLKAEVTAESDNLTFKNTYDAETGDKDIAAQIEANKILYGRKMSEKEFNFEVVTRAAKDTGVFIEEVVAKGMNAAADKNVKGKVIFAGASETSSRPLIYTTESLNQAVKDGYATKDVVGDKIVWNVNYTARELTDKLPQGVKAEKISFDFEIVVTDKKDGKLATEVQYPENGIVFENRYETGGTDVDTDPTNANAYFKKVLTGRDWLESDIFTFTIEPQNGAPAPERTTTTVTAKEVKAGEAVPFGFGKIHFTDADMEGAKPSEDGTLTKTFTYLIKENDIDATKMPGVTKDGHTATLTITVTDNQKGELSATAGAVTVENGTFTNKYISGFDYNALSGLQITKVLHGRDMEEGQFTFTVTPKDDASAEKLGKKEFKNKAAEAEAVDTIDVLDGTVLIFNQADAGKTFTYEVSEIAGTNTAYTYDTVPRTVTIEVTDNKNATLTVTTTVTKEGKVVDTQSATTGQPGKKATVAFENTYNAGPAILGGKGNVAINATKSLTNRPMENGEFTFDVLDNKGNKVTTGTNSTDGIVTFNPIEYTTDKLIADVKSGIASVNKENAPTYVYTYEYTVVEAPTTDGVTGITTSFAITVHVTDDGNGKLAIEVVYPEGKDPLPFENAYGTSANAELNINGHKNYVIESGNNAPDITGKYTFTIKGSDGAPMPEKTEAKNDAAGNVDFGKILFTMENVFGKDEVAEEPETSETEETEITEETAPTGEAEEPEDKIMPAKSLERTKTFTYTVTESGYVAGVDNDSKETKTFTVKVTDNGDGTISVEKSWTNLAFEFTNTYRVDSVDYNISTDLSIKKELTGREMKEGEFTFELVNSDNEVIATATNKTDGTVTFDKALTYKEPGTYNYVIREKEGTAGGVQYDSAEYTVTVVVTDNGDGTLSAKAEIKSRGEIIFRNIYEATPTSVTLGASKVYEGNKLKDEQFTFVLKDKDGKVISKSKNTANGQVVFETITYDETGTYEYTISEKNDKQKNVTYDESVYNVTVTVTDNGEGSLLAEVAYADGKAPVFTNKYTKPAEPKPDEPEKPQKPSEPQRPTSPKTGDEAPIAGLIIVMIIALATIVTVCIMFFKKRRRG